MSDVAENPKPIETKKKENQNITEQQDTEEVVKKVKKKDKKIEESPSCLRKSLRLVIYLLPISLGIVSLLGNVKMTPKPTPKHKVVKITQTSISIPLVKWNIADKKTNNTLSFVLEKCRITSINDQHVTSSLLRNLQLKGEVVLHRAANSSLDGVYIEITNKQGKSFWVKQFSSELALFKIKQPPSTSPFDFKVFGSHTEKSVIKAAQEIIVPFTLTVAPEMRFQGLTGFVINIYDGKKKLIIKRGFRIGDELASIMLQRLKARLSPPWIEEYNVLFYGLSSTQKAELCHLTCLMFANDTETCTLERKAKRLHPCASRNNVFTAYDSWDHLLINNSNETLQARMEKLDRLVMSGCLMKRNTKSFSYLEDERKVQECRLQRLYRDESALDTSGRDTALYCGSKQDAKILLDCREKAMAFGNRIAQHVHSILMIFNYADLDDSNIVRFLEAKIEYFKAVYGIRTKLFVSKHNVTLETVRDQVMSKLNNIEIEPYEIYTLNSTFLNNFTTVNFDDKFEYQQRILLAHLMFDVLNEALKFPNRHATNHLDESGIQILNEAMKLPTGCKECCKKCPGRTRKKSKKNQNVYSLFSTSYLTIRALHGWADAAKKIGYTLSAFLRFL
jgi:ketosteroid isomerase-like protein